MLPARIATVAVAAALVLAACTGDGDGEGASATDPVEITAADLELDCVARGYACSWSEVPAEVAARTDVIMQTAAALIGAGESVADVAARIEAADDVAEVAFDELGIMFRVDGGMPVTVDVDPTGTGQVLAGPRPLREGQRLPSLRQAQGGVFTGCGDARDKADGVAGVSKAPNEPRHALILSPYQFELNWTFQPLIDNLLYEDSDTSSLYKEEYGGSITQYISWIDDQPVTQGSEDNVIPEHFCGWEKYDTIMLMTHGRALCAKGTADKPSGCTTAFSVGRYDETPDELRELVGQAVGVTVGTANYAGLIDGLSDEAKADCYAALEALEYPEGTNDRCFKRLPEPKYSVTINTDFFKHNYPNGLPDRLIFLAACQGLKHHALGNTEGDMAAILGRGGSGYILGFDKISLTGLAEHLMEAFTFQLGYSHRITDDFITFANDYLDDENAHPDFVGSAISELGEGELGDLVGAAQTPTWGQDVVRLKSGGEWLVEGAEVVLAEPAPRDDVDSLELTLVLTDVAEDESPDDFAVEVLFNDDPLDLGEIPWEQGGNGSYTADVVADLPKKFDGFEWFDLTIRASLPAVDGAPSSVTYEDLTAEASNICDRLTEADIEGVLGFDVTAADTGGFGDFYGGACQWNAEAARSDLSILVQEGAAAEFRAQWEGSPDASSGFGDVAVYDPFTGQGNDCPSATDRETGGIKWICFVNLTVAVGDDTLYFNLGGNVVGDNGPGGSEQILRELVEVIRDR